MDLITSLTSRVLNKAMDGMAKRQVSISSNIANADTPNYRRRDVSFEGALKQALTSTRRKLAGQMDERPVANNDQELEMTTVSPYHFGASNTSRTVEDVVPEVSQAEEGFQIRNDGNSVDLEAEMAQSAKNTQRYIALANLQSRRGKAMKNILQNG